LKRACVIGAGLAGLTTAFELQQRGWDVTVLDEQGEVARGASHANGSLLTPSMAEPWNAPGVHRHLVQSLFNPISPLRLWPSAIPSLLGWGVRFLRNSTAARSRAATTANFHLASYSLRCLDELRDRVGYRDTAAARGLVKIFRDFDGFHAALLGMRALQGLGLRLEALDADGAIRRVPTLAAITEQIAGALFFPDDECADAHLFCMTVAAALRRGGATLRLGAAVHSIDTDGQQVRSIMVGDERIAADHVVVAAGVRSSALMGALGIHLPIAPAKGYTVTLPLPAGFEPLPLPVADDALHAAVIPVAGGLRLAGTAEFAGHDLRLQPHRTAQLLHVLEVILPTLAAAVDRSRARTWIGLRPVSADGVPFVGSTGIGGLYVNAGHGPLGWTMAAGSARLLADEMTGGAAAIDPRPYRVHR
jgi:D-amino-acid dehydrogenase